jgi:hypothetical protein
VDDRDDRDLAARASNDWDDLGGDDDFDENGSDTDQRQQHGEAEPIDSDEDDVPIWATLDRTRLPASAGRQHRVVRHPLIFTLALVATKATTQQQPQQQE